MTHVDIIFATYPGKNYITHDNKDGFYRHTYAYTQVIFKNSCTCTDARTHISINLYKQEHRFTYSHVYLPIYSYNDQFYQLLKINFEFSINDRLCNQLIEW